MMSTKLVEPMEMRSGARFVLAAPSRKRDGGCRGERSRRVALEVDVLVRATAGLPGAQVPAKRCKKRGG